MRSSSSSFAEPLSGSSSVARIFINVDLPAPIGPEQSKHTRRNLQRYAAQRADTIGIGLFKTIDRKHAPSPSLLLIYGRRFPNRRTRTPKRLMRGREL